MADTQTAVARIGYDDTVNVLRPKPLAGLNLTDPCYRVTIAGRQACPYNLSARDLENMAKLFLATIHSDFPTCFADRGKL